MAKKDPYEDLIDTVLFPGAYQVLTKTVQETKKKNIIYLVDTPISLLDTTPHPGWNLILDDLNWSRLSGINKSKASGIFIVPPTMSGLIREGILGKWLYGDAKWQQTLITVLYAKDTLRYGQCNRFEKPLAMATQRD